MSPRRPRHTLSPATRRLLGSATAYRRLEHKADRAGDHRASLTYARKANDLMDRYRRAAERERNAPLRKEQR